MCSFILYNYHIKVIYIDRIEGKAKESETKPRVHAIHDLKEKLKRETDSLKDIKKRLRDVQDKQRSEKENAQGSALVKDNAELRHMVEVSSRVEKVVWRVV